MKDTIISLRNALRIFNAKLRETYNAAIVTGELGRSMTNNPILRDHAKHAQKKLLMLVPFERAYTVLSQRDTPAEHSVSAYRLLYVELLEKLRVSSGLGYYREELLEGGVADLAVLVPVDDAPVHKWGTLPISQIAAFVDVQISAENKERAKRSRSANRARKAFLDSFTKEQVELLRKALDAAKAQGQHAINLSQRELDSL
jgi:hypothetical protein